MLLGGRTKEGGMMSVRLFVGNLPYDVTEAELREFVSAAGTPISVRIPTDRETGRPRGFAFVEWTDAAQADDAIRRFNQQVFKGRPLVINEARPREEGGGGGPRSNYAPTIRDTGPAMLERAARPEPPARNFGPDAAPRGRRKTTPRGAKGERVPKGPIKEKRGGQIFAGAMDDSQDDTVIDDTPFWLRADSKDKEEE